MSDADTSLPGKVAFVAGGYGGIGEACARALARQGATTVIAGRNAGKAEAVARALEGQVAASSVAFDARDVASIRDAVGEVASRHGRIDFLVNCVGTQQIEPMIDVTEEAFDRIIDVNLKAAMFLGQAVARVQIAARSSGRHVHLLSVRAMLGMRDRGYSSYCSSKGGLVLLVRQHAVELTRSKSPAAQSADKREQHRRAVDQPVERAGDFTEQDAALADGDILIDDGNPFTAAQNALEVFMWKWPNRAQSSQADFLPQAAQPFDLGFAHGSKRIRHDHHILGVGEHEFFD